MHYSWNPDTKRFIVYHKGYVVGTMWWDLCELYFKTPEDEGSNCSMCKDIVKLMERIEREQFSK